MTDTAPLLGSQVPTFQAVPSGAVNSESWQDVVDLCAAYGHELDPWQGNVLRAGLTETTEGEWAASRVCLSASRQNGKSEILTARELAGLVLFKEELLVHSAHLLSTALESFLRIKEYFENYDDLRRMVKKVREGNSEQSIEMRHGGRLLFKARARSAGRGLSPDVLLLDEAQILPERLWAALLFAMSARPHAQAWLAGTPPAPEDDGEAMARLRSVARGGKDARLAWLEWAADATTDDFSDPHVWAKTNPAFGVRVTAETVADELASTDRWTFARERLGVWPDSGHEPVITPTAWRECATTTPPTEGPVAYAVDMSPERTTAAISAARRTSELVHVEVVEHRPVTSGTGWIVAWLTARTQRGVAVVIDAMSPAASLVPALTEAGVKVTLTGTRQMIDACGGFYDAVTARTLSHFDQEPLNVALAGARRRYIGQEGGWGWNRRSADITPLVAATLAHYGVTTSKRATRQVATGRTELRSRVVVLG
jgi:hypothetical protein